MNAPLFRQIGPYTIERQIGLGGMALVFLAHDTRASGRAVALKVVPDGPDDDARETVAAERRGAELQRQFLAESDYVPSVYEVGHTPGYLYIAMEYLDGEDLSVVIGRGPMEPRRAADIALQLCRFLEEIDHLDIAVPGGSPLTLLHNDLKPKNVRMVAGDRVKVLDFGAAKALSMSRRATRNEFYSTPYLSPECLESGDRDRQADAWAVGVILYEMVTGRPPFRADDTRRLEDRIRSRRPPEPAAECGQGLQAIIGKLLAPYSTDRYPTPAAIRADLERFLEHAETDAEREGWPERANDEPPTRRAPNRPDDEPPTRRTPRTPDGSEAIGPVTAQAVPSIVPPSTPPVRRRRWMRTTFVVLAVLLVINEACVMSSARRVADTVPVLEFDGLTNAFNRYDALRNWSYLGVGTHDLGQALQSQALTLAERVTSNYRTPSPTVREAQWLAAARALERAVVIAPGNKTLRGTLRYAQGHLRRIDGEADKSRRQTDDAQRNFAEAVTAFREAAAFRPDWPDPFLGLARTFIYGLEDIDRGADAMTRAQQLGHALGSRETAQMADGYRARGETLERSAGKLRDLPQEREFLTRSREAYRRAIELYAKVADLPQVPTQIRTTQRKIEELDRTLGEFDATSPAPMQLTPSSLNQAPNTGAPWA